MILHKLPDARPTHARLTLGKDYETRDVAGIPNGVSIALDDPTDGEPDGERAILLRARFDPPPEPTPTPETAP